jgi:pimeloyl-ACP methyl ester carboxylesterase
MPSTSAIPPVAVKSRVTLRGRAGTKSSRLLMSAAPADHRQDARQPGWPNRGVRPMACALSFIARVRPLLPIEPARCKAEGRRHRELAAAGHDGRKAHYDGIKPFSETDFCEDLKRIDVATLAMHEDHDKIVPYKGTALLSVKLVKCGALKIYRGCPSCSLPKPTLSAWTSRASVS